MEIIRPLEKLDYQKFGPFTIMEQINIVAFQLKLLNSMKFHLMFHVSLLLPCFYHSKETHEPPPPIIINGEQEYEVEGILYSRISHRQLQYLVHWQGYDISERSWELVENLSNAMEKMKNFHMLYSNKLKAIPCGIPCKKGGDVMNTTITHCLHHCLHQHNHLNHHLHHQLHQHSHLHHRLH